MYLLISSGLLYLLGISIVLVLKPELMFSSNGKWKEFGIGRSKERYTWLPFWLFAIMWAIISYIIVIVIASHTRSRHNELQEAIDTMEIPVLNDTIEPVNITKKGLSPTPVSLPKNNASSMDMKKGYYILNTEETMKKGIPKYIYLGPEAPNMVFHQPSLDASRDE
jgi:hypothetical protein